MATKIALINMKGGVGKSTLAINIAWEFATLPWNKRVLVVDLDPQFNCSQYLVGATTMATTLNNGSPTVWDIFEQFTAVPGRSLNGPLDPHSAIMGVYRPRFASGRLDLMPSRLELSQTLKNPAGKEQLLKLAIGAVEDDYDLVVIDCAPTESLLTTAAYLLADSILVPVRPEFLSTIGLPLLANSLDEFGARYPGQKPELLGLAFNAISDYAPEERTSVSEVVNLAATHRWYVFENVVPYSKSFAKGAREGRPIFSTSYARHSVKTSFATFARELAARAGI